MKTNMMIIITIIFLASANASHSQTVDPPYEVGTWQGFRTVAISFTFDDGSPNQFSKAIPMFNEFNFKLTLFTVTSPSWSWAANWTTLQNVANQGHEIASHTVTHLYLNQLDYSQQMTELKDSQDYINSHITGQRCITIAYPYCVNGTDTLCDDYYIAARTCAGAIEASTPGNFMSISSIICGENGPMKTKANFVSNFNSAISSKGWCVYLLHGIDGDGGWSSLPSDTLRAALVYLNANQDKFWVSSFSNVARYIKERNAVSVTELSSQDSSFTLQVTDALNDTIFNYPITLRRPLPEGWPSAVVTQNGHARNTRIVEVNTVQYIQFEAVPDSGEVLISKSNLTGLQNHGTFMVSVPTLAQNYPNPFNPSTTINFELVEAGYSTLKIFDIFGREVKILLNEKLSAGQHSVVFDATGLASGLYFYNLRGQGFLLQRKMLLLR